MLIRVILVFEDGFDELYKDEESVRSVMYAKAKSRSVLLRGISLLANFVFCLLSILHVYMLYPDVCGMHNNSHPPPLQ